MDQSQRDSVGVTAASGVVQGVDWVDLEEGRRICRRVTETCTSDKPCPINYLQGMSRTFGWYGSKLPYGETQFFLRINDPQRTLTVKAAVTQAYLIKLTQNTNKKKKDQRPPGPPQKALEESPQQKQY